MTGSEPQRDITITGDGTIIGDHSTSVVMKDVHIGDKVYAHSELEELRDHLARAVAAYEARMYQRIARSAAPPERPYKFLYAFDIEDADIFFGREAACDALYQTVRKDRLSILHAKSGAGKTSLLNAGLAPRLISEARLPLYARVYEDPALAIKRALVPPSLGPWPALLPDLPLPVFLGLACGCLGRQTQELVLILDQFEEFFIFWPEREHREPFMCALASCYADETMPLRIILSLRNEYYADLADLEAHIPTVFHNHYRLAALSREDAQAAITAPLARLDAELYYEPALLETLLDDLDSGGMELAHLQIICSRLYETLPPGQTALTLAAYNAMARAEGVLGAYLDEVLAGFSGPREHIAREVLKALVSSEATRRVLNRATLGTRLRQAPGLPDVDDAALDAVLERLVDARLLRREEDGGDAQRAPPMSAFRYEMAHDYLAERVRTWLDRDDLAVKRAEELLERELANWRASGTLMSEDHLDVIAAQAERMQLSPQAQELLLRSALDHACHVRACWAWHTDPTRATAVLTGFLLDEDREGARALAEALWPEGQALDETFDPVVTQLQHALSSGDAQQQQRAREIGVFIGPAFESGWGGRAGALRTAFRALVPGRWSAILTLALGSALGGLVGGIVQAFLGLAMHFVGTGMDSKQFLIFIALNAPAIGVFAGLVGAGMRTGHVLSRGRSLIYEVLGAACGGALGGLSITFYFTILDILNPGPRLWLAFVDLTVSSALLAAAVAVGIRVNPLARAGMEGLGGRVLTAVVIAGLLGVFRDLLFGWQGVFPGGTLVAIFLSASVALGICLSERMIAR